MEIKQEWEDRIPSPPITKESQQGNPISNQVWGLKMFDNNQLLVVVGDMILCYDCQTGQMSRQPIKGIHKGNIHCLVTSGNGQKFATGSSDRLVVIWHNNFQPEVRYSHNESVQCMAFNPITNQLFSGGVNDFIVWSPDGGQTEKFKCNYKILCCDFSSDGQLLSYGTNDGRIVIRNKSMQVVNEVNKGNTFIIWTMKWGPISPTNTKNVLCVGSWDKRITFYDNQGKKMVEKMVDADPIQITYMNNNFIMVSLSDNTVNLYTKDMNHIQSVTSNNEYIWDIAFRTSKTNDQIFYMAQSGNDGLISYHQLQNKVINSIYQDKYVQRIDITDILIQSLQIDKSIRIKCRELVKNVHIYKELIAVQLTNQILIYQQQSDELKYKLFKKMTKKVEHNNQLIVTQNNIIYNQKTKLVMINYSGQVEREWVFNSEVTYLQNMGGAQKNENVLIGLFNGQIYKVNIDNPFPILLIEQNVAIKQVDINRNKNKLSIIDQNNNLSEWDLETKQQVYSEMNVESVCYNSVFNDLLSYSGNGIVFVKCSTFNPTFMKYNGQVIGFKGNQLFILDNNGKMQTLDVPQTNNVQKYTEKKDFETAYQLANLGATESDFQLLGQEALGNGFFDIAKKAFLKIQDLNYLDLTNRYEQEFKQNQLSLTYLQAELKAYQRKFNDAGNLLIQNNMGDKAIELFMELKRWEEAKRMIIQIDTHGQINPIGSRLNTPGPNRLNTPQQMLNQSNTFGKQLSSNNLQSKRVQNSEQMQRLLKEQSEYYLKMDEWQKGCELLKEIKQYKRVIELYGKNNALEQLIEVCRQLDKADHMSEIRECANYFKQNNHHGYAKEAYLKLNDNRNLMSLHIELEKWEEAFILAKQNQQYMDMLRLPYAEYLFKNDRYEDALKVYRQIKRPDISNRILQQMADNAVNENRYKQASHFYHNLAIENLVNDKFSNFSNFSMIADIYYVYHFIYQYTQNPLPMINCKKYSSMVYNASKYLANMLNKKIVQQLGGINRVHVYQTLAIQSRNQEAFKTSRLCYEQLQKLNIQEQSLQEIIELNHLLIKSKPFSDNPSLFNICYRCNNSNQIVQSQSNNPYFHSCLTCQHPFLISFGSFELLPLVQFTVQPQIDQQRIQELLNSESDDYQQEQSYSKQNNNNNNNNGWDNQDIQQTYDQQHNTPFYQKMNETCEIQLGQKEYLPVVLGEKQLQSLDCSQVFKQDFSQYNSKYPSRYYKNMQPDVMIENCVECGRFFLMEEYEIELGLNKKCPFCNYGQNKKSQSDELY